MDETKIAVSVNRGEELLLVRRLNSRGRIRDLSLFEEVHPGPMQRIAHTSIDCGKTWSRPFLVDISGVLSCPGRPASALFYSQWLRSARIRAPARWYLFQ